MVLRIPVELYDEPDELRKYKPEQTEHGISVYSIHMIEMS